MATGAVQQHIATSSRRFEQTRAKNDPKAIPSYYSLPPQPTRRGSLELGSRQETTHPQAMPPPRTRTSTTRGTRRKVAARTKPTRQENATALDTRRDNRRAGRRNARQCEQQYEPWHKRVRSPAGARTYSGRRRKARTESKQKRQGQALQKAQHRGAPLWILREENVEKS